MPSQLDFLHDKRKKLHQIDVERSLLKYKFRTSGQRTCYQCGSCFNLFWTICSGVQKIRITDHITNVQAIVEKPTQPKIIVCEFEFIIKTADGAA